MTMAEILDVLAKKSTDTANEIVLKKLPVTEYKKLLAAKDIESFESKIKTETGKKKGILTKMKDLFIKLLKGLKIIKNPPPPPPPKEEKKVRTGWATKAVSKRKAPKKNKPAPKKKNS